jgi:hypothetical protein
MGALLFGLGGSVFGACWLGWMLRNDRTPDRGFWRRSVTSAERPVEYWGEVSFVAFFLLWCLTLAASAVLHFRIG